ncbi:L-threonylcarbamoyladenylate synthase [Spiroplasma chinense]|uniref:L-threonylcarbamoyladenylate synthase n=1 Tax=Spiroplasma chinense TaxID=216932 RepID=A0A5B9Y6P3_9MOLU|nr:Sua5/YciO/YrdC/YwlC family protein [Spiroplasma chinense]QEH62369.1 L-threonylcarbamoyladenylate synthase [Spiroplasma chinense]
MKYMTNLETKRAIELINNNEIVILPTDTIYGISAKVSEENRLKINRLKESELDKPLIILVSSLEQAEKFIELSDKAIEFLNKTYPTTVIEYNKEKTKKNAVRLVKREDLVEVINQTGPIFSTSVNKTGQNFLSSLDEFKKFLNQDGIFWSGELSKNPSNIVDLTTNEKKR